MASNNPNLEAFVNTIRNLYQQSSSGLNVNYTDIHNAINSHLDVFNDNGPTLLENVLPVFTLPGYTLPHIAVLYAIISQINNSTQNSGSSPNATAPVAGNTVVNVNLEKLLSDIENCINMADCKQIEVASDIYSELCHYYTRRLLQLNTPKRGLLTLKNGIRNIQMYSSADLPNTGKLTTVHTDILQLSLASKNFSVALDLLSNEILDIHKLHNTKFDSKYLLGYFYYGGCIYGAMKQYDSALFFLEQALTVPALVISQIMIESYKKFILISLISKGKLPNLPKYTSRIVINQIKPLCASYHELALAFINFDFEKLNTLCQKYHNSFQADNNLGLIKQLQQSFYKKNIQRLTKTFITLSLSDMAQKVKLPSAKEAETYMLNMIKDGEIFATINQKDGMVSFHDNPEKYDNPQIMENLTKQMFACIEMDSNIKKMDKEITTHPHYIQKCQNSSIVDDSIESMQSANITSLRQQSNANLAM